MPPGARRPSRRRQRDPCPYALCKLLCDDEVAHRARYAALQARLRAPAQDEVYIEPRPLSAQLTGDAVQALIEDDMATTTDDDTDEAPNE
jgi:hypothetical protein